MTAPDPTTEALAEMTSLVREGFAAMRARVPQRDTESAREEFDRWLAAYVADRERAAAERAWDEALRHASRLGVPTPPYPYVADRTEQP